MHQILVHQVSMSQAGKPVRYLAAIDLDLPLFQPGE
jgi:hypothetical protein